MPKLRSLVAPTAFSSGCQKLGHPVPLSNFVSEENSSRSQPAHRKMPLRCSSLSGLEKGRSVASLRNTWNWFGVSSFFHSSSVCVTSNGASAAAPARRWLKSTPTPPSAAKVPAAVRNWRRAMVIDLPPLAALSIDIGPAPSFRRASTHDGTRSRLGEIDGLQLEVRIEPFDTAFAARARLLEAAERHRRIDDEPVDRDAARAHAPRDLVAVLRVLRVHGAVQAVDRVVGLLHRVVLVLVAD